jgi:two-component system sensor kinase FixL
MPEQLPGFETMAPSGVPAEQTLSALGVTQTGHHTLSSYELAERRLRESVEKRLRESEELFQGLFDEAPVACHELNHEGRILRVNQAECKLMGFKAEEMIGRQVWEFIPEGERRISEESVKRRMAGQLSLAPFERGYTRGDGAQLILEIHTKLVHDAVGTVIGLRSFMFDITARKRAEQALQNHAAELGRSNAELEQFAYVASHDLQEPLRKIQAFGERLNRKYSTVLGPEGCDYLTRMESAAARMQVLINDLLMLSRVVSQARPFADVDLTSIVRQVAGDLESRLDGGAIEIDTLPPLMADKVQMGQLFQNLIGNGLKFRKPDVPPVVRITGRDLPSTPGELAFVEITVEDNGIGFDEKYAERIFQIFQRLHGKNEYQGTGIGLAVVRKIVDRHGGRVAAYSAPGQGAKFVVILPKIHSLEN